MLLGMAFIAGPPDKCCEVFQAYKHKRSSELSRTMRCGLKHIQDDDVIDMSSDTPIGHGACVITDFKKGPRAVAYDQEPHVHP